MTQDLAVTSDQIRNAVAALKTKRPAYTEMLNFYEQMFAAQEDAKNQIQITPLEIPSDILSMKMKEQFPLISLSEFLIDTAASEVLFRKICQIAVAANEQMGTAVQILSDALENGKLLPEKLFTGLLCENDALFEENANTLGIDKAVLAFVTYNSIRPSLNLCAEQLSTYLEHQKKWEKGYCPVCGSSPVLSMLQKKSQLPPLGIEGGNSSEGERFLFCSFCWHRWLVRRIGCPFCDNRDANSLQYFYTEEEQEYRVDVCDKCGRYIKTVDTRKMERIFYPPLEQVVTLHLDMKAGEMKR